MIKTLTKPFIRRRRRRRPVTLTLVEATYNDSDAVHLRFDRPVNIDSVDVTQVTINDPEFSGNTFVGTGEAVLETPTMVYVPLAVTGTATGTGVQLTASADTGIVAAGDGAAWAGVTELQLPFP
jgi:hypothetical protein